MDPQWVSAIANSIACLAIVVAAIQLILSRKSLGLSEQSLDQIAEQIRVARQGQVDLHDLERRKQAISLTREWATFTAANGTAAKGLLSKLDLDSCKAIALEKALIVNEKYKDYLERNIEGIGEIQKSERCREREVQLSASQSSLIRQKCASYLNLLETIIAASHHGIADKQMILEQFSVIVLSRERQPILENFRTALGGADAFPAIHAFIEEFRNFSKASRGKPELATPSQDESAESKEPH